MPTLCKILLYKLESRSARSPTARATRLKERTEERQTIIPPTTYEVLGWVESDVYPQDRSWQISIHQ
jgi:hypothetical protein